MKFCFRSFRGLLDSFSIYFYEVKTSFAKFLKRPDAEQDLIETFQNEYNAVEEDFRGDPDVKAELHQRLEELKDKLWDIADKRRDEAEAERISIIEDRWIEDQSYTLTNMLVTLVQAETDKFLGTRQMVIDIYRNSKSMAMVEIPKNTIKVPFCNSTGPPPIEIGVALIAISEQNAVQRKDTNQGMPKEHVKTVQKDQAKEKKEKGGRLKNADNKAAPQTITEKENTALPDPESTHFPDINNAIEFVLQALASPEYSLESFHENPDKIPDKIPDKQPAQPVDLQKGIILLIKKKVKRNLFLKRLEY